MSPRFKLYSKVIEMLLRFAGVGYLLMAIWKHDTTDAVIALCLFYITKEDTAADICDELEKRLAKEKAGE